MKPATQRTLRVLFGFRDTLVWNGVISAVMIGICASFRPTWPAAAIYGALLIGGFFPLAPVHCLQHPRLRRRCRVPA